MSCVISVTTILISSINAHFATIHPCFLSSKSAVSEVAGRKPTIYRQPSRVFVEPSPVPSHPDGRNAGWELYSSTLAADSLFGFVIEGDLDAGFYQ